MMQYNFEWDPQKAQSNQAKHDVSFEQEPPFFVIPAPSPFMMRNIAQTRIDGLPSESLQQVLYSLSTTPFMR